MSKYRQAALPDLQQSAHTFALAGWIIALPAVIFLALASWIGWPPAIIAVGSISILIVTTGALHEDGLADTADGFWGGHTTERKLAIMRDSAIGTYGVLALIASFALRVGAVAYCVETLTVWQCVVIIAAIGSLSRAAMLFPWITLNAARPKVNAQESASNSDATEKDTSGLSIRYGEPNGQSGLWAIIAALPALLALCLFAGIPATFGAVASGVVCVLFLTRLARHHIGGHTGDVLGTAQQFCEMGLYLGLLIAI